MDHSAQLLAILLLVGSSRLLADNTVPAGSIGFVVTAPAHDVRYSSDLFETISFDAR